jgi:type VI protein secretion system component VasK
MDARRHVVSDPAKANRDAINASWKRFCSGVAPVLRKFPFRADAGEDVTEAELIEHFAPRSGQLWQFHQQIETLVLKQGRRWMPGAGETGPRLTPQFLQQFNRMAAISEALFPGNAGRPGVRYRIRFDLPETVKSITGNIDGEPVVAGAKQYSWPGPPESRGIELRPTLSGSGVTVPFANHEGYWGLFAVMIEADPRESGSNSIGLTNLRSGRRSKPAAVRDANNKDITIRLNVLEFPGGVETSFDREFFSVSCPTTAVQ